MEIAGAVVVITGASSGLGRATAHAFAKESARLVLAAQVPEPLEDAARECRAFGAEAIAVSADLTREGDVDHLARQAVERFGRIDVWINNAAVTSFTPLVGELFEPSREVIETNLFGTMYGARTALTQFERQGRGVLINVGSVLSFIGHPFVPAYAISKFAVRGLTESLRVAYAEKKDIHICGIYPYAIDTPHMEAAGNRIGRRALPLPPVQSPEKVARAIVDLARHPRHEVFVPRFIRMAVYVKSLLPDTTDAVLLRTLDRFHLGRPVTSNDGQRDGARAPHRVHGNAGESKSTPRVALGAAGETVRVVVRKARRRLRPRVSDRP